MKARPVVVRFRRFYGTGRFWGFRAHCCAGFGSGRLGPTRRDRGRVRAGQVGA